MLIAPLSRFRSDVPTLFLRDKPPFRKLRRLLKIFDYDIKADRSDVILSGILNEMQNRVRNLQELTAYGDSLIVTGMRVSRY